MVILNTQSLQGSVATQLKLFENIYDGHTEFPQKLSVKKFRKSVHYSQNVFLETQCTYIHKTLAGL